MEKEDFGDSNVGRVRKYLWNLTEYPEDGLAAQVRWDNTNKKRVNQIYQTITGE